MNTLSAFVSAMLAISIAAERLVAILKSIVPWLAKEPTKGSGEVDLYADWLRRVIVFLLAFVASWVTAAFLVKPNQFELWGYVPLPGFQLPAIVVGVLGTGGSALWSSLVNYSSALKDIKIQTRDKNQGVQQGTASATGIDGKTSRNTVA